jgi:arylsulfatase A-like enzyme
MGEHTLSSGKMLPYEEDIHVPLIIRGPGIQPGTTIEQITANIDIAPTLAELANARTANFIDGRSLVPFLHPAPSGQLSDAAWRESLLLEAGNLDRESPVIAYRGIRTEKFAYVEYENGELEYYDLAKDPYELQNLAGTLSNETLSTLHSWLEQLKSCQADACRKAEMIPFDGLQSLP